MTGITLMIVGGTYAPPPPTDIQFGWFGGGAPGSRSTVDRISYASDTGTAIVRGPLSSGTYRLAATGNSNYGWFGGGAGATNKVDRIDYAADTSTASVRGSLSQSRFQLAATGNADYGWFGGGLAPSPAPSWNSSRVDRINYASDASTASIRGPLSLASFGLSATGNSNYGWFTASGFSGTVDRIDYASDLSTASVRGSIPGRYGTAATGNSNYGWFGGGTPSLSSRVDRIDYAADTSSTSARGPLTSARYTLAATGDSNFGWFGGGNNTPNPFISSFSTIDRINYAADTAVASARGPLSSAKYQLAATGGFPG